MNDKKNDKDIDNKSNKKSSRVVINTLTFIFINIPALCLFALGLDKNENVLWLNRYSYSITFVLDCVFLTALSYAYVLRLKNNDE